MEDLLLVLGDAEQGGVSYEGAPTEVHIHELAAGVQA